MLKCLYPDPKFSLANFKPFYCFVRFCSECSHSWSKPKTIFIRIFRVLHTVQFSRFFVVVSLTAHLYYHKQLSLSTTFFILFFATELSLNSLNIISQAVVVVNYFFLIFKTFSQIRKPVIFDFPCICRPTSKHVRVRVYHFSINLSSDFHLFFR